MTNLEKMKLKAELARVQSGKVEQEYQIALRQEEIERLEKSIESSDARIAEIEKQLSET